MKALKITLAMLGMVMFSATLWCAILAATHNPMDSSGYEKKKGTTFATERNTNQLETEPSRWSTTAEQQCLHLQRLPNNQ